MFINIINMASLNDLKGKIESLSKEHQIEILRILKKSPEITLNENNNGIFINLSSLTQEHIKSLYTYLSYIKIQKDQLSDIETEKNKLKENFFSTT